MSVALDTLSAIRLPIAGSLMLFALLKSGIASEAVSILVFLSLVVGGWSGLVLLGNVADACGLVDGSGARQRALDDRFVGSFGVAAIGVSLIVQLSSALGVNGLTLALTLSPTLGSIIGILTSSFLGHRSVLIRLRGLLLVTTILVLAHRLDLPFLPILTSLLVAFGVAAALTSDRRNGVEIGSTIAGHAAYLCLLIWARAS